MISNRSIPGSTVIPVLAYPDVAEAVAWLTEAFGFTERLRIGTHRVQMHVGDGAMVAAERPGSWADARRYDTGHSVMVRIEDVDGHHARATARGARILEAPADYPYGERQYTAEDLAGHRWTFSQSIADVDPETWGGTLISSR